MNPLSEMSGRHALVTGAGAGIGLATARVLHWHGARIAEAVQQTCLKPFR